LRCASNEARRAAHGTSVATDSAPSLHHDAPSVARNGAIEIHLLDGARVGVEIGVDREVLRLALSALGGP